MWLSLSGWNRPVACWYSFLAQDVQFAIHKAIILLQLIGLMAFGSKMRGYASTLKTVCIGFRWAFTDR